MAYHKEKLASNTRNIYKSKGSRFEVRFKRDAIFYHIGTFDTLQEAIEARDKWLKKHS
jgi:hypothetical protein